MGEPSELLTSAADARPRPTSVRWRILAVLLAYSFLSWFNRVSISVAYDERIQSELGISEQAMGYVYSALLFAYMLCMTPGGWFVDRRGGWLALVVMGLGSGLLGAMTGLTGMLSRDAVTVLVLLLVVRAVMGVFTAPIYPASGHILAAWLPAQQRAGANGAVMAAALLGIACTYGGFGTLMDLFGWPRAFLITGGITALVGLLWAWYGRGRPAEHSGVNEAELEWIRSDGHSSPAPDSVGSSLPEPEPAPASGWALLRNRSLVLLTLSYAAIGYFEYLFYFWMHYYFEGVRELGKNESRLYSTIQSLAMAAGMLLGGWFADRLARTYGPRWGRAAVVVSGMLGGAALLGCGLLATTPGWIVLWFSLSAAAVGATEGPCWATAIELGGRQGGTAAGIFNTGGNAGGVLAPVLTPFVSNLFGWPWGIGLGGLVCLVGACLWWRIDPAER
jgi:ACS family D-galactonate transporter-like MFS transporter